MYPPRRLVGHEVRCINAPASIDVGSWSSYTPNSVADQTTWCMYRGPPILGSTVDECVDRWRESADPVGVCEGFLRSSRRLRRLLVVSKRAIQSEIEQRRSGVEGKPLQALLVGFGVLLATIRGLDRKSVV